MKSGKQHMTEEIELPTQEKIRAVGEEGTYKYSGILEAANVTQRKTTYWCEKLPKSDMMVITNMSNSRFCRLGGPQSRNKRKWK